MGLESRGFKHLLFSIFGLPEAFSLGLTEVYGLVFMVSFTGFWRWFRGYR